ncbi:hypothetical protein KP509_13G090700 [Ceratopteris richardii]|uniref:U-box domain-containing protein n=1 Tax=Ceratopteris richardii TaxID=49495 RepID=A0A8T2TL42_CERRI|nr:hypothetical protein KP509_13G090700 [Ceratopteris richardii]
MHSSKSPKDDSTTRASLSMRSRDWNGPQGVDDPDGIFATVAQSIEQLRANASTAREKESISKQLAELAETKKEGRTAIGTHSQAIPLLVALVRSGTLTAKLNAAAILGALCQEEELRVKVLLGGCIPPLLSLLKSSSSDAQLAAAQTIYAVSHGGVTDHVGCKIFATENVVPKLWEQLQLKQKLDGAVEGLLTGSLQNLCNNTEGFWPATLEAGGIEILVRLLYHGSSKAQANASSLLASLMTASEPSCKQVLNMGAVEPLLRLVGTGNDISVRAEAAGALSALSATFQDARLSLSEAGAISILISAIVAPSKEFMQGRFAQALQENAMNALANIFNGMSAVILSIAENIESSKPDAQMADVIGALAYALMVYDEKDKSINVINPEMIENILVKQLKSRVPQLVQDRAIEALASLYGNSVLQKGLDHAEGKRMLVGLVTMANAEVQEDLVKSLRNLCNGNMTLWQALRGREGVQLLISLLGLSSEQQQEYAVALLSILTEEVDGSKWAITAAGGIPPLVQLLETGSAKAKEDAALILGNLCTHSEDIRACVETADAVPALLWLLKNASAKGQDIAAKALTQLVRDSDASTISQLAALLQGDLPQSKVHVLNVLGCLLCVASKDDILKDGMASNDAFQVVLQLLNSANEETQGHAASVLAKIFDARKDLRENPQIVEGLEPLVSLLSMGSEKIAMQAAKALAALFLSIEKNREVAQFAKLSVLPLISLIKSCNIAVAEMAATALANLLMDGDISEEVPAEDMIMPLTVVLREGTHEGKEHAAGALAQLLKFRPVDDLLSESIQNCDTVVALVAVLSATNLECCTKSEALEALASLARARCAGTCSKPPWSVLAEIPYSLGPLVTCIAVGNQAMQEKAIEVLSRLCRDQPIVLGDLIAGADKCIAALADHVIKSRRIEVKVGGTALLICAFKEHRQRAMEGLHESGSFTLLIQSLVDMLGNKSVEEHPQKTYNHQDDQYSRKSEKLFDYHADDNRTNLEHDPAVMLGGTAALWLLSIIASHDDSSKVAIMEAGAIELLAEKLANVVSNAAPADVEDNGSVWVSMLLLAILFQQRDVTRSPGTMRAISSLAVLLKAEESIDRYFAAQALASLICNGSRGTLLAVANSGVAGGLIPLLGSLESDIANFVALSEEFSLVPNPDQVALERLFRVEDIRVGATARKAIPFLVDLLKPIPDRPGAPSLALSLLTQLAKGSTTNKLAMAEAGALDALTKYLSLGPQDAIEEATADLLRILFSSTDLRKHESALGAVNQLIAVLRLGTRGSRYNAARALQGLFTAENIRFGESGRQAIPPLVEMLNSGSEKEQRAAIGALISLSADNPPKALAIADAGANAVEGLWRVLCSDSSLELKEDAADLCKVLFGNSRVRSMPGASNCIQPLIALLTADSSSAQLAGTSALDNLLDDEQQAEIVAAEGAVVPLVSLVVGDNFALHEAAISALTKLGKDRPLCKLDMVKAGIIDSIIEIVIDAPDSLCALMAELLRILTNNSSIAKGTSASQVVEPLFHVLTRPGLSTSGQHSAMQALVNILEKPQRSAMECLTPNQAIEPLVPLLDSPSQTVQQLAAELLSLLLVQEQFQRDVITQYAIVPLVRITGLGVQNLQQKAIKALEKASKSWPNAVADAGGIIELSKVIVQSDPQPPHALWESAAYVLSNILRFSSQYYLHVPLAVLVRLLKSTSEATVVIALNALLILERDDASSAEEMAQAGAVEALLELLRCHQCEEAAARLLEALFNNVKVREMKSAKFAIAPLSQYLLDPQTRIQPARLLAALALGDLFQHDGLARTTDAVSACRALVSLLEDQPSEEMKMISVCALQNLVMHSKSNKRAVAEAGGVQVLQELLNSSNTETAGQAAALIKLLFSNNTIQEYATSEIIRALTASLEREFWATGTVNEDMLKAIEILFYNFPRLRGTEAATLCIPQLVGALKAGTELAQESALDALLLLRQSWSGTTEVGKTQSMAMVDAIPVLQLLVRSGPEHFQEKAEALLQCLPGTLVVTIKRGHNLKQSMGNTNAFCKLTLGNSAPRQTKVIIMSFEATTYLFCLICLKHLIICFLPGDFE